MPAFLLSGYWTRHSKKSLGQSSYCLVCFASCHTSVSERTKTMKSNILSSVVLPLMLAIGLVSCSDSGQKEASQTETALAGTISVSVDPEIIGLLGEAKALYDKAHPNATITLVSANVHTTMDRMLNHQERIAIIARDYTPSEDSAIANDPGDTLPRTLLGRDALVFFVAKDFPYDTMNSDHIRQWLGGESGVKVSYPKLASDPTFIISGDASGSIYGNIVNVVLGKKKLPSRQRIASVPDHDSVVRAVQSVRGSIGVGYMSQVLRDTSVKPLRLSYTNADGSHEWPKPVHLSYLIMGKYPFPVPIWVYLRDLPNQYNLPSGFMQYMTRNGDALKTLFAAGIEPAYAKFSLTMPEE